MPLRVLVFALVLSLLSYFGLLRVTTAALRHALSTEIFGAVRVRAEVSLGPIWDLRGSVLELQLLSLSRLMTWRQDRMEILGGNKEPAVGVKR